MFGKKHAADTMENYLARMDSIRAADSLSMLEMEQSQVDSTNPAEVAPAATFNSSNKYHVITGSFKTPEYAESYKTKMASQFSFPEATIVSASNGFNLVSVKQMPDMRSAINEMMSIRDKGELEAWIYVAN